MVGWGKGTESRKNLSMKKDKITDTNFKICNINFIYTHREISGRILHQPMRNGYSLGVGGRTKRGHFYFFYYSFLLKLILKIII